MQPRTRGNNKGRVNKRYVSFMSLQKKQEIDEEDVTKRNLQLFEFSLELAPNW